MLGQKHWILILFTVLAVNTLQASAEISDILDTLKKLKRTYYFSSSVDSVTSCGDTIDDANALLHSHDSVALNAVAATDYKNGIDCEINIDVSEFGAGKL